MGHAFTEIALRYTYPLYSVFEGKHGVNGSSVLLTSGDKFYLATARHVGIDSGRIRLFGEGNFTPYDEFLLLPESIDISIVTIIRPDYFTDNGFDFLPLEMWGINAGVRPRELEANYLILGYPHTRTRREVVGRKSTPSPFAFRTRLYGEEEHIPLECSSLTHLAFLYLSGKLYDKKSGVVQQAPDLRGMSGAGVWDISLQEPVLVGLLTEQRPITKPLSLIATRIDTISEVLRTIYDPSIPISRRLVSEVNLEKTLIP